MIEAVAGRPVMAFANTCRELGVETTEAEFEILEMPQKKTFGLFGGSPAKVRAYIEEHDPAQEAADYLKNVLREMGLPDASVEIHREETGAALILSGDDIGFIIGHRGGDPGRPAVSGLLWCANLCGRHLFPGDPGRGQLPGEAEGILWNPWARRWLPGGR